MIANAHIMRSPMSGRSPLSTLNAGGSCKSNNNVNKPRQRNSFGKDPLKSISGTDREELRNKKRTSPNPTASSSELVCGSKERSSPSSKRETPTSKRSSLSPMSSSPVDFLLTTGIDFLNLQERLKLALYNMELHEMRIKELEKENNVLKDCRKQRVVGARPRLSPELPNQMKLHISPLRTRLVKTTPENNPLEQSADVFSFIPSPLGFSSFKSPKTSVTTVTVASSSVSIMDEKPDTPLIQVFDRLQFVHPYYIDFLIQTASVLSALIVSYMILSVFYRYSEAEMLNTLRLLML